MRIPVDGRKKLENSRNKKEKYNGKFQGAVKVLMESQRGTVSENGYPQQGGGYRLFLEKPNQMNQFICTTITMISNYIFHSVFKKKNL